MLKTLARDCSHVNVIQRKSRHQHIGLMPTSFVSLANAARLLPFRLKIVVNKCSQSFTAKSAGEYVGVAIHNYCERDGVNLFPLNDCAVPPSEVGQLRPCHTAVVYRLLPCVMVGVERYADYAQAVALVFVVYTRNSGHFGSARTAPTCPKVDDGDFILLDETIYRYAVAVEVWYGDVGE